MLQIVFFAILFAVALSRVEGRPKQFFLEFCESLTQIMLKFVGLVMAFAPVGIGAAIAVTVGKSGIGVLKNLAILVGTLYGALVGAGLFKLMYDVLAAATPQYWQFWLGLALVLLVLFARGGVMGLLAQAWSKLARSSEQW